MLSRRNSSRSLLALTLLAACNEPPVDGFRSDGGASPDPTGVIEGTVLYAGPRPPCERETGVARPIGRVVLTLFEFNNPPPPEGAATSALNLLTVPGSTLFGEDDCLPEDFEASDLTEVIMRSADFTWPEIPLGDGRPVSYQIRGFYDSDGDFIPFFSVSNGPTSGDIGGGAFEDTSVAEPEFLRIRFDDRAEQPLGQLVSGVSVVFGSPIITERPVFRLGESTTALDSAATFSLNPDPLIQDQELFDLASMVIEMYDRETDNIDVALNASGMSFERESPAAYAWYIRADIDLDDDDVPDLHPILPTTPWVTPVSIMRRQALPTETNPNAATNEAAARIPAVLLFPSVRPGLLTLPKTVYYPALPMSVPPVAVVQTHPALSMCRIPYFAPGNVVQLYESGTTECQELPTGLYSINVFHGVTGVPDVEADATSDTGLNLVGGVFAGQTWSIPNPFGDATQLAAESIVAEQGFTPGTFLGTEAAFDSMFLVSDADPTGAVGRIDDREGCEAALDPTILMPRAIDYVDFEGDETLQEVCCEPIRHLCDVELCEEVTVDYRGEAESIRSSPTSVDENGIPNCVPFLMPAACCIATP